MPSLQSVNWQVFLRDTQVQEADVRTSAVISRLRAGSLARTDLVWTEGMPDWIEVGQLEKLLLEEIRAQLPKDASLAPVRARPAFTELSSPLASVKPRQENKNTVLNENKKEQTVSGGSLPGSNELQLKPSAAPLAEEFNRQNSLDESRQSQILEAESTQPGLPNTTRLNDSTNKNGGDGNETASNAHSAPLASTEQTGIDNSENAIIDRDAKSANQTSGIDRLQDGASTRSSKENGESSGPSPEASNLGIYSVEETGTVSAYDPERRRGLIQIDRKGRLHFSKGALPKNAPKDLVGAKVQVRVARDSKGVTAASMEIISLPSSEISDIIKGYWKEIRNIASTTYRGRRLRAGDLISSWSNLAVDPITTEAGGTKQIIDAVPGLAALCLKEPWCFDYDKDRDQFAILRRYIRFTFYRLFREHKIAFSKTHATFNTGLVDELFEPIYALFERNNGLGSRPYRFIDFCVVGDEGSGKELMHLFALPDRPEAAQYMKSFEEVFFDPDCEVNIQHKHVIDDAILKGRYPLEFLLKHMPASMRTKGEPSAKDRDWLTQYVDALNENGQKKRAFASDLRYATEFARKRARWNFKTAIPNYFPTRNEMSLLLPLALLDEKNPDMALVTTRINEHEYYGVTVYPLDMAYQSARLVCKPISDWLTADVAIASDVDEDDSDEGDLKE